MSIQILELAEGPEEQVAVAAADASAQMNMLRPSVAILGTRGIPAQHGGFETFAERLALYLVERGWDVTVYCQRDGEGPRSEAWWNGIRLIEIPERRTGAAGTVIFDLKSTLASLRHESLILTLGYNTALFCAAHRMFGHPNLINMDGLEWQRPKWGRLARAWLYLNERLGCWLGNHLIADHPEIARHLATRVPRRKITTIPYGSDTVTHADPALLRPLGVRPHQYALVVARPEPENSILEIVSAFSARRRGYQLVVLGRYEPNVNAYHAQVVQAASDEVVFAGAVYDKELVAALRFHARLYVHGHTVGGTNPALVEALGAGCPVLAHDNRFNRWVAGEGASYFRTRDDCDNQLTALLDDTRGLAWMSLASRSRHAEAFTWDHVLHLYEQLLLEYSPDQNVVERSTRPDTGARVTSDQEWSEQEALA